MTDDTAAIICALKAVHAIDVSCNHTEPIEDYLHQLQEKLVKYEDIVEDLPSVECPHSSRIRALEGELTITRNILDDKKGEALLAEVRHVVAGLRNLEPLLENKADLHVNPAIARRRMRHIYRTLQSAVTDLRAALPQRKIDA